MKNVCFVITTRGNYGKLQSVIEATEKYSNLNHQIIVGGGAILHKYGKFFSDGTLNGRKIDREAYFLVEGENPVTMAKSTGLALLEFTDAFEHLKPDIVIVLGDRFESMAITIAARYTNIPVAHIEGGEVSGSIDNSIRNAISQMAQFHFPATQMAVDRLLQLGINKEYIFQVGASSIDMLSRNSLNDLNPLIEAQRTKGVGPVLDPHGEYLIVIQHPVTTEYGYNRHYILQTIEAIDTLRIPTFWIWPNMDAGTDEISKAIREYREKERPDFIHFWTSLPIELYGPLLNNCSCIVGNSSSGIREAAFLGVPTVNIGSRQKGRERTENVIDVDNDKEQIKSAILKQLKQERYNKNYIYGDGLAGEKIAKILSNIDFNDFIE